MRQAAREQSPASPSQKPAASRFALRDSIAPRPNRRITTADIRRTINRLGLLQLDYVNVLVPAHFQVLFSRLGAYDRSLLDKLVYKNREFTEQWAHEASIVPMDSLAVAALPPRGTPHSTPRIRSIPERNIRHYVAGVLTEIEAREGTEQPRGLCRPRWDLFRCGRLVVRHRRTSRPGSAFRLAVSRGRRPEIESRAPLRYCRSASSPRITSPRVVPRAGR